MINSSYALKKLGIFVELSFSHIFTSAKFELHLMSITVDVNYACYTMASLVIFVLDKILHECS